MHTIHTAAKGSQMNASYSGVLSVDVMSTAHDPTPPESIPFQMDMLTVPNSSEELLSADKFYAQQGHDIFLTHPSKGAAMGYRIQGTGCRMQVQCESVMLKVCVEL